VNGGCVSAQGYNAIGNAISTIGLPPGFGTGLPTLTACPTTTTTTTPPTKTTNQPANIPTLPALLVKALKTNGEQIVSTVWDPQYADWVFLTNKGGVYNISANGQQATSGFFGSYLGQPGAAGAPRTFQQVLVGPTGGYTLVATDGSTFNFGPKTTKAA
jgi:hypothetical protein